MDFHGMRYEPEDDHYEELPAENPPLPPVPSFFIDPPDNVVGNRYSLGSKSLSDASVIMRYDGQRKPSFNPSYEKVVRRAQILSTFAPQVEELEPNNRLCCVLTFLTLLLLFSMCALVLSVYTLILTVNRSESEERRRDELTLKVSTMKDEVSQAEALVVLATEDFVTFKVKVGHLEQYLPLNMSLMNQKYSHLQLKLTSNLNEVMHMKNELIHRFDSLNEDLHEHLEKIGTEVGPPGPAGADSLAGCYYFNTTVYNLAAVNNVTRTLIHPESAVFERNVVMFASCSSSGTGTTHTLTPHFIDERHIKYHCACSGHNSLMFRYCTLHLWLCPLTRTVTN